MWLPVEELLCALHLLCVLSPSSKWRLSCRRNFTFSAVVSRWHVIGHGGSQVVTSRTEKLLKIMKVCRLCGAVVVECHGRWT